MVGSADCRSREEGLRVHRIRRKTVSHVGLCSKQRAQLEHSFRTAIEDMKRSQKERRQQHARQPQPVKAKPAARAQSGSSLFGVGCVRATGAMPAELDPLARRRCRPTGGVAPTSSFMVLVFL